MTCQQPRASKIPKAAAAFAKEEKSSRGLESFRSINVEIAASKKDQNDDDVVMDNIVTPPTPQHRP